MKKFINYNRNIAGNSLNNYIDYSNTGFEKLTNEAIIKELQKQLNFKIDSLTPINTGHVNKSFVIKAGKNSYFCKISPLWYKKSLSREKWCLDKLFAKQIPVPKVVCLIEDKNEYVTGHEILILEYISGSLLSQIPNVSDDILIKIHEIYSCLHSFKVQGFGWLDTSFIGNKNKWSEFLLDIENLDLCKSISKEFKEKIDFLLNGLRGLEFKDCNNGRLLYGDFNLDNFILSPSGKIYSLDFQNCFSGDPLYDYPLIIDKYPSFIKLIDMEQKQSNKLLKLYTLRYLLTRISYFIQKNDSKLTDFYLERFNSIYQELRAV